MKSNTNNPANASRRKFIKTSALTGLGLSILPAYSFGASFAKEKVRIAFIGVGGRGRSHLRNLMARDDVIVPAICDIDPEAIRKTKEHGYKSRF